MISCPRRCQWRHARARREIPMSPSGWCMGFPRMLSLPRVRMLTSMSQSDLQGGHAAVELERLGRERAADRNGDVAFGRRRGLNRLYDNDLEAAWARGAVLSIDKAIAHARRGRGERKRPSRGWGSLTPAELDVARLIGEGLANKEIRARLFISPCTVRRRTSPTSTQSWV